MKLNLGCRLDIRDGYENIDIAPIDPRVISGDARTIQYPANSIEEIIAQDVLEHILPSEAAPALRHWFAMLAPQSKLIVRVPDLRAQCAALLDGTWDSRAFTYMAYAGSNGPDRHCNAFTMDRLVGMMEGVGFSIVATRYEHDNLVIDPLRSNNANIVVEAIKP